MIEIKCFKDIEVLKASKDIPALLVELINEDLVILKKWSDEDDEVSMEEFNTDDFGYGYIVVLDGNESEADIKNVGLTEGLEGTVPEAAYSYFIDGDKWTRAIVIYNDSYSMSFWLRNSNIFSKYEVVCKNNSSLSGNSVADDEKMDEPF